VQLGAAHALGKARPVEAARIEPQPRRIDQIGGLGQAAAQTAMRPRDHQRQQLGEQRARSIVVGVRQGRAPRQLRAQMVEPRRLALDPADNLAPARRAGKLAIEHRQELALARQPARPRVCPMHRRQPLKIIPRHMLQKLVKYAIVVPHGIDPLNRVRIVLKRPGPSGINAVHLV
jgi:hypothetical protein